MSLTNLVPKSVFITGCNRGIGLELVKQFLKLPTPPKHVFATCRDPEKATDLTALAKGNSNLSVMKFEVTDYSALPSIVQTVSNTLGGDGLNLLFNNAGMLTSGKDLDAVTAEDMRQNFEVNALAPLMLIKAFLPLLKKSFNPSSGMSCSQSAIVNMSSVLASVSINTTGGMSYSYRTSKCAVNMITKNLSVDLKKDGVLVVQFHPGWVQTDMGGAQAPVTIQDSCLGILGTMAQLNGEKTGAFLNYTGKPILW